MSRMPKGRPLLYLLRLAGLVLLLCSFVGSVEAQCPEGFVHVTDVCDTAILEIRYHSTYNFMGVRVDGYHAPQAILTRQAAQALQKAGTALRAQGYMLKIFDAYRPQSAVDHFARWGKDLSDTGMQAFFYPDVDKARVFELGYVAGKSGHSRGSTVDLTLVDMRQGKEVDMGSPFDYFGSRSHHGAKELSAAQTANREILKKAMLDAGFSSYSQEWWHYTLRNEPYPDRYFNFPVE